MPKTARDLMIEPSYIDHEASIDKVVEKVKDAENTLIVQKDGEFVGEVHEHSLMKILVPEDRIDEEKVIGILGLSFDTTYVAENVEDLMTTHEVTVEPDETIGEIAFLLDREDLRAIPVEEDGEIIGVVHQNQLVEEI